MSPPPDDDRDFPDPDDWAKDPAEREREREAREAAASHGPADDFDFPSDDPFAGDGADADPFDDGDGAEDEPAFLSDYDPDEITLKADDAPRPHREEDDEEYDGSTFALGEATVPPGYGSQSFIPDEMSAADGEEDGDAPPARAAAARKPRPAAKPKPAGEAGGPPKPKIRDWLETRCKREAQMYALGAAVMAPVAGGAVSLTWGLLFWLGPGPWPVRALFATVVVAGLFVLNGRTREPRTTRVMVEPKGRDVEPIALVVPRGAGLTWMMYLTGSRDLPGIVRVMAGLTMFGPRLCALIAELVRRAKALWSMDVDLIAEPVKTLVRAEGKVSFAAFLEAHKNPPPQTLVRRVGRIDGILFLPTSTPPGLTASPAMKEEFSAWRERWRDRRAADGDAKLYD